MLDIIAKAEDPRVARLSNFTDRPFVFEGVDCAGLEGPIQAFKCPDFYQQKAICALSGKVAKRAGSEFDWRANHTLYWRSASYCRFGREYYDLITRMYDAVYAQDPTFMHDLFAIGFEDIGHSIGNTDMRATVLTEVEMIHQLNRLRIRVLQESA